MRGADSGAVFDVWIISVLAAIAAIVFVGWLLMRWAGR